MVSAHAHSMHGAFNIQNSNLPAAIPSSQCQVSLFAPLIDAALTAAAHAKEVLIAVQTGGGWISGKAQVLQFSQQACPLCNATSGE